MPTFRQVHAQRGPQSQRELSRSNTIQLQPPDSPHLLHRQTSKRLEMLSQPLERRIRHKVPLHHRESVFGSSFEDDGFRGRRTVISNNDYDRYRPLFRYNTPDPPIKVDLDSKLKYKKMTNQKGKKSRSEDTKEVRDSVVSVKTPEIKALLDAMHKDVGDLDELESSLKTARATVTPLKSSISLLTSFNDEMRKTRKVRNIKKKQKLMKTIRRLSKPKTLVNLQGMNVFVKKDDPNRSSVNSTKSRKVTGHVNPGKEAAMLAEIKRKEFAESAKLRKLKELKLKEEREFVESAKLKELQMIIEKERKEKERLIKSIGAGIVGMALLIVLFVLRFQALEYLETYLSVTGVVRSQSWWEFSTYSVYDRLQFPETAQQVVAFISGIMVPIGCGVVFLLRALHSLL